MANSEDNLDEHLLLQSDQKKDFTIDIKMQDTKDNCCLKLVSHRVEIEFSLSSFGKLISFVFFIVLQFFLMYRPFGVLVCFGLAFFCMSKGVEKDSVLLFSLGGLFIILR